MHGPGVVPVEWIDALDVAEPLTQVTEDFIHAFHGTVDSMAMWASYPGY
jgi:hypothetical protein